MRTTTNLGVMLKAVLLLPLLLWIAPPPLTAGSPGAIRIVITRDLRGWLEPCDCKAGVLGGIPQRATLLDCIRPMLTLDAGDMIALATPNDHLSYGFMIKLCEELTYDVVTLGRREIGFSADKLRLLGSRSDVRLISRNAVGCDREALRRTNLLITRRGIRSGITGLFTSNCNPGRGVSVADSMRVARRLVPDFLARCDLLILLAALTPAEMGKLTTKVKGINLLLGGWVPRGSTQLEKLNQVPYFLIQGKEQYTGELALPMEESSLAATAGKQMVLGPEVPSRPDMVRRMRDYQLPIEDPDLHGDRDDQSPRLAPLHAALAIHGSFGPSKPPVIHRLWPCLIMDLGIGDQTGSAHHGGVPLFPHCLGERK
jgi:hypothetical protein